MATQNYNLPTIDDYGVTGDVPRDLNALANAVDTALVQKVSNSQKGAASGVATLDASTKLPAGQLPVSAVQATTADVTYYVRTDGNDNNNGLANTTAGAFKTIGKAISMLPQIIGHNVTINVAAGTYAEAVNLDGFITKAAALNLVATGTVNVLSVKISNCFGSVNATGFTATTTTSYAFLIVNSSRVILTSCIVTAATSVYSAFRFIASNGNLDSCTASNRAIAVEALAESMVYVSNMTGTGNAFATYMSGFGSYLGYSGTFPNGGMIPQDGGMIVPASGVLNPWGDNTTSSRPAARAYAAATQALSAGVMTKALFSTEAFDNTNAFTNSAFIPGQAGIYQINALATFLNVPVFASAEMFLYVNGQNTRRLGLYINSGTGAATQAMTGSAAVALAAGDFVEIYVKASAAVTLSGSTDTSFESIRLA